MTQNICAEDVWIKDRYEGCKKLWKCGQNSNLT
jgi:hypothetical protein